MAQIKIKVDDEIDEIIDFLSRKRKLSKSSIAKEFMIYGLSGNLLPVLLDFYSKGEISLKYIIRFTNLSPSEVMDKIAELGIEPPIPDYVDEYTEQIKEQCVKTTLNDNKSDS